ncbi:MAG: type II toxin-antitoxin system RelE/ParE family toxin [Elusimicrobia bacterium]|nr:type II toxin-antitoxin system RelE/ParE family toxin [Elusimicrobiota bacterium]
MTDILSTPEFAEWLTGLDPKSRAQVDDRLDRIRECDHFGDAKYLGGDLFELRWRRGRRVYYAITEEAVGNAVLILLGGDKNGQKRDIAHARRILQREAP